jgi:DnaK suppressor protein
MATSTKTGKGAAKKAVPPAKKTPATKKSPKAAPKAAAKAAPKPVANVAAKTAAKPVDKKSTPKAVTKAPGNVVAKVEAKPTAKPASKATKPAPTPASAVPTTTLAAPSTPPSTPTKTSASKIAAPVTSSSAPVSKTNTVPKAAAAAPTPAKPILVAFDTTKKYAGLTEAEIVKQPESEYMSKAQLAFFKEKLTELRGTILHNATDTGEHLRDVEVATDPSDRATQEEEYTLELRTRDRERKLLKKVDKCLRMIDDGSFGWCEETGEPIGLARLIARPTATLSIEAQERRERMQKLYGD